MRIYDEAGTELVKCFLQDFCPRMFNITQATAANLAGDSTSAYLLEANDPVARKQSFYPRNFSRGTTKRSERQSAPAISVTSPEQVAAADGNAHPSVSTDDKAKASPAHAVESAEDSGSGHPDAQAGDAEKEDLLLQSSTTCESKILLSDSRGQFCSRFRRE